MQEQTDLDKLLDLGDELIARICSKLTTLKESNENATSRIKTQNDLLGSIVATMAEIVPDSAPIPEQCENAEIQAENDGETDGEIQGEDVDPENLDPALRPRVY
jgi:hypothetical protein